LEVHVKERTKHMPAAVALTLSGAIVAWRFGGLFWGLVLGRYWCRVLLVLLAAQWLTTLASLWNRPYQELRNVRQAPLIEPLAATAAITMKLRERRDV